MAIVIVQQRARGCPRQEGGGSCGAILKLTFIALAAPNGAGEKGRLLGWNTSAHHA